MILRPPESTRTDSLFPCTPPFRSGARCVDSFGAPLLDESQQGVDLAHLGPRQRDVQQRRGVVADRRSVSGSEPAQLLDVAQGVDGGAVGQIRSEEHTSELQSLMRISYAVFCLKKKNKTKIIY